MHRIATRLQTNNRQGHPNSKPAYVRFGRLLVTAALVLGASCGISFAQQHSLDQQLSAVASLSTGAPGGIAPSFGAALYREQIPEPFSAFIFSGALDGTYNTNIFNAPTQPVSALTSTPTASGAWEYITADKLTTLKAAVSFSSLDSAQDESTYEKSLAVGSISLTQDLGKYSGTTPPPLSLVLSYTPQFVESKFFNAHLATWNDFAIGPKYTWLIPACIAGSSNFCNNLVQTSLTATQRVSDPSFFQYRSLMLGAVYSTTMVSRGANDVGIGLAVTPTVGDTWYTTASNSGRVDQLARVKFEIDYPDFATQSLNNGTSELWIVKFAAQYTQNFSNRDPFKNNGWLVGPSLTWRS
jgi:hypothetical protein